ncbi:helix-turn-helix transcriptional regulator [Actinokineospora soli]|uniref:Helix-turn-helix transcriptional regulator n=1 Tax=Actinokineospora soli TaxID=1048753 RepID=A0ABW2TKN7_9PSEU
MGGQAAASFGEVLRAHRLRARLTQQELADRSGISVRALRYIERGSVGHPGRTRCASWPPRSGWPRRS